MIPEIIGFCHLNVETTLLRLYKEIADNNDPSIRKFASINLYKLMQRINQIQNQDSKNDIIQLSDKFLKDEHDFVRIHILDGVIELGKQKDYQPHALSQLKRLVEDASWRVQYVVCDKIE